MTHQLREKFFANEVLRIGDIVEDSETGESLKIIDRGSNYITVTGKSGVSKKWLNEVKYEQPDEKVVHATEPDFVIENNQIKIFGYETKSFDLALSSVLIEQFNTFEDMYSKHQIIKLLDNALSESDINKKYDLVERVFGFYTNHSVEPPVILEGLKTELERRRIVEILASVAGIQPMKSIYQTAVASMKALRAKYKMREQWQVLLPLLKLVNGSGITGIMQSIPFNMSIGTSTEPSEKVIREETILYTIDEHVEMVTENKEIIIEYSNILNLQEKCIQKSKELISEYIESDKLTSVHYKLSHNLMNQILKGRK